MLVQHTCGYKWKVTPSNLLSGKNCPNCKHVKKYTLEEVRKILEERNLRLISDEYKNANAKIQFVCNVHSNKGVQESTLSQILHSTGCKYCGYEKSSCKQLKKIDAATLKKEYAQHGLKLLDVYKGARVPLKCSCLRHPNEILFVAPTNLTHRKTFGCRFCQYKKLSEIKRTTVSEVKKIVNECGYIYSGIEYSPSGSTIVLYQCPKHLKYGILKKHLDKFKQGSGCPICNSSHGERRIEKYLKEHNIDFKKEYTFKDLIGEKNQPLRYDFYIPNYHCLIEFQGIQHYLYNNFFYRDAKEFSKRQKYDILKKEYAINHNYIFLEIPYTDIDCIDNILQRTFFSGG